MNDNLCRVCLSDGATISIFKSENKEYSDIPNKFNRCLGEEILDLPGYPRNICQECYCELNEAVSFIDKYTESCLILEERLKSIIKEENPVYYFDGLEYGLDDTIDKKESIKSELYDNEDSEITNDDAVDIPKPAILLPKSENDDKSKTNILSSKISINPFKNNGTTSALKKKIAILSKNGEISIKSSKFASKKNSKSRKRKSAVRNADKKLNSRVKIPSQQKNGQDKQHLTSEKPPILCEHCGKSFKDKVQLLRHIGFKHTEKKSLECPDCKKIYSSEYALSRHKRRVHHKEKKLCSECGKAFSVNNELQKHYTAVHLKIRKYKMHPCKFCGKEYITTKSLLVHERSVHTGERPAVCTVCDARFVHEEYLTQHMRLHTGETPYKCPICARGYAQSGNMKSHIKHNHSISQLDELTLKTINPRYLKFMKP